MIRTDRAFTLIELILALAIFSVVALCVYGTFWSGIKLNQRARGESEVYHQMRMAVDLLALEVENAVSYDFTNSYPDQTAFEGKNNQIAFFLASDSGLVAVRYRLASSQEGYIHRVIIGKTFKKNVSTTLDYRQEDSKVYALVREQWDLPDYLNGASQETCKFEIIAMGIKENGLTFSYGYLPEGKEKEDLEGYQWRDEWSNGYVPMMARLRIQQDVIFRKEKRTIDIIKNIFIPDGSWGRKVKT